MLLQALVRYYEILSEDVNSGIPMLGYSRVNVSYVVNLSKQGEILNIIPLKIPDSKGKKYVPISMVVPEQEKRAVGIKANFLCDNSSYVFGIDNKGKPERTKECFKAFKEQHTRILEGVTCDDAVALVNYVNQWDVETASEHPVLKEYLEDILVGANIIFQFEEGKTTYIHQNQMIKTAWESYKNECTSDKVMQCLVTGKRQGVARLHPSVKGIRGGQAMGNSLVSFNAQAYESYGNDKSQGLNAPVSEYATFAYTTTLSRLLSDQAHKVIVGDTTVVFWAESPNSKLQDCLSLLLEPSEIDTLGTEDERFVRDESSVREIKSIFQKIADGKAINLTDDTFDKATKLYMLGLTPNAARISMRFFIQDSFGGFIEKIVKHYLDMSIEKQFENEPNSISVWRLLNETVSPTSSDKSASPLLAGATMRSILQGTPYPVALYNAIIIRIRAEHTINYCKASIIKAYLLRKHRTDKKYEEVLTMALNEQSSNKPYVLGRLFAVLEKAQMDASPGIKTTIKDRYFTSACATPSNVFPVLLRLSNHHISKAEYGYSSENKIKEIMDILQIENNPFPKNLSLEDQGAFILGYYHQKNTFYKKGEK